YFEIRRKVTLEDSTKYQSFEIHHNLTIQSGHQQDIYLTPDISVVNTNAIISDYNHYSVERSAKKFCYVKNADLQTFCEVKNFNPFPELLYNFIGVYNELKAKAIDQDLHNQEPLQIAPSLMISGKENEHTKRIKKSLESRYKINIFFDLFERKILSNSKQCRILSIEPSILDFLIADITNLSEGTYDLPF